MVSLNPSRLLQSTTLAVCTSAIALTNVAVGQSTHQQLAAQDAQTTAEEGSANEFRPLNQENSLLSMVGAERLMGEAAAAVGDENYALAQQKLQDARQVFNQLSNFYQELAASFSGIDNRIANSQRDLAVETAQKRDEATYQLALVHRAQNEADLAVPLLVQVIRSQNPTTEMGKKAYQQLFELGFVESPYPKPDDREPTSATPQ
ncbi:hypothetical protein PJF56_04420 [Roseofilum sp. BLCC_M91]|uniref:Tetratricopeptide repeat protein n=1 Tax=Roseofilum halophilum BLCC-M91 TaxID=3022259 RepID=A0ABT7BIK3_9CYAN|nr:hypothetical protein [Roseofilum halophilum]MDJ1178103.1 hypothetical protein [Roseofilum halophilum BLCC-M91]